MRSPPDAPSRVAAALGALLLLYYLLPLVALGARLSGGTLAGATAPTVVDAATTSVATATASTALATAFGVPLAYWLARAEFAGKRAVTTLVVLPLVLPPVVSGILLLSVFGPDALGALLPGRLSITRTHLGVVVAQTFVASPFVVVTARTAFEGVDVTLEEAARTLGAGEWSTFRRVILPLAWPGVLAGVTLAFARSIGEFGATLLLAYYPRTLPVEIWVGFVSRGLDAALPVALVLLVVAVGALVALAALGADAWSG